MKNGYDSFLKSKLGETKYLGIDAPLRDYHLFPHEQDLASWALRRGVAAIFADTGLGKTAMQLAWADTIHRTVGCDILILAPLAVAEQTVREGVIRRGVELWTNPNETVLSPFAGIGSEGYVSLQLGRKFIGIELKESYYRQASMNLENALRVNLGLFSEQEKKEGPIQTKPEPPRRRSLIRPQTV